MSWNDLKQQERVVHILKGSLKNDRLSHAYLFAGPRGAGKREMAIELAKALYCEQESHDSCNQCANCRRIQHGNHPDVYLVEPDGGSIKISQIRELQRQFSFRSSEGNRKIYILDQADTMTVQAANSLLKFLEEPSSQVTAILLTEKIHAMLPTILSRCQLITFSALPPETIIQTLTSEGMAEPIARTTAQLAAGLNEARKLCQSERFAQLRNQVVQLSEDILFRGSYALVSLQDKLLKSDYTRDDHVMFLDLYQLWLRDLMLWHAGKKDEVSFIDHSDVLNKQALRMNMMQIVKGMEQVQSTRQRLEQHANPQLSFERMALLLQEG